jgi:site-specific recombinase XerD
MNMSKREALNVHTPPPFCHATVEEYAAFLQTYTPDAKQQTAHLRSRKYFVKRYPNLQEWFAAPLPERIGWAFHEGKRKYIDEVSYQARLYLMFLALCNYAPLDWNWLIAVREINATRILSAPAFGSNFATLIEQAKTLGYKPEYARAALTWPVHRLFLHLGSSSVEDLRAPDVDGFFEALDCFHAHPDVALFFGSAEQYRKLLHHHLHPCFQVLRTVLYHYHQAHMSPPRRRGHQPPPRPVLKPRMEEVAQAYLRSRRLTDEPHTVANINTTLHQFIEWLAHTHPSLETFSEVTRDMVMEYAEALNTMVSSLTHQPFAAGTKQKKLSALAQFFQDTAKWQWEDVPGKSLLQSRDLPKLPERIPRYIPQKELDLLMPVIRELTCPYRRAALLIARWSGARREEIQRLSVNCLDAYPDGTPRLHIPAGKTKRERLIPLNQEAADAIHVLQACQKGKRGLPDRQTGVETHYLFLYHGKLLSVEYLFASPLQAVCETVGLMTPDDKATITAHRFRHTVGTQLAQRGARFRTIQKILGHQSAKMTAIYLGITDEDVRNDYQAVLGADATIAGPGAELVRSGTLAHSEVAWLKENYFKTELELGRCLRLPQEGPCECDLYLTCAKFVTSPEYAPRLRRRINIERELVEDAKAHSWQREVERHECTIRRLEQLLTDLGESLDGPEAFE